MKMVAIGILFALAALATPFMEWREQLRLWFPLVIFGFFAAGRIPQPSPPLFRALLVTAGYLYLSQLLTVAFSLHGVKDFLLQVENSLVVEVPDRLEGIRHVMAVALLALLVIYIVNAAAERRIALCLRMAALLAAEMLLLLFSAHAYRDEIRALASGNLPFFTESDDHIDRIPLALLSYETRGPNPEATFFASLGDFLICGTNTAHPAPPSHDQESSWPQKAEPFRSGNEEKGEQEDTTD